MKVAGIDTSTDILALGLYADDEIQGEINIRMRQNHNERLLPLLERLLRESQYHIKDLDGLAVVSGPGSFTGLRISLSTVKAFDLVHDFSVTEVSSLELLVADKIFQSGFWLPVFDARRERVYTALFAGGHTLPGDESRISSDRALSLKNLREYLMENISSDSEVTIIGPAVRSYKSYFKNFKKKMPLKVNLELACSALPAGGRLAWIGSEFLRKGRSVNSEKLLPRYLKESQAEINYQKEKEDGGQ